MFIKNKIAFTLSTIMLSASTLAETSHLLPSETETSSEYSSSDDSAEKLIIWGENKPVEKTDQSNPNSVLTPEDMISINASTTEDLVNYEPSLVIRKRFIGDSNGTMGIRGSNMFQTSRSMVFADGIPLHYLLQTRWSGAPRWSLVSADEIAQIEIIYGPYSAEYGGNAMGGVVKIETAIPTERRFHLEGSIFSHDYEELGFEDSLNGYKGFFSYSDKLDELTIYTSYNRLENQGHPQTYRLAKPSLPNGTETEVQGAISSVNEYGETVFYYADNGIDDVATDNYKIKIGYEIDQWFALFNIAFENRSSVANQANNYLLTSQGTSIWNGSVTQDGIAFKINESHFAERELARESLLLGFRLQGELSKSWWLETDIGTFNVLKDESLSSLANLRSPAYTSAGEIREYDNTGWSTAEIKLQNDQFLSQKNLAFVTGVRYENYELEINNYTSNNYRQSEKSTLTGRSGGKTSIEALYSQLTWQFNKNWDAILGGRYENWESHDGFYNEQNHIERQESRFSPKFSLAMKTQNDWLIRYSAAKAFRFPIVEELFQNERRTQGTSLANANLEPENGFHQNLMFRKNIENGHLQINYFVEEIDDVIFAQSAIIDNRSINTFIPIDTVDTKGMEFSYNQFGLFSELLDVRFNVSYTDAKISKNTANPSLEGKQFARMPKWRANWLATFHLSESWRLGGGIRYASNSYGDLDNRDSANQVFGSQDSYTLANLKTSYLLNENTTISLGIDNMTNQATFVHHPWPQRTAYIEASLDL
ncbi:TonB-dependent receptor [Aliikangiella sp. IMCC44359]|uniref:TonB-dependent receptor n=1 Tax=Aliikangiella sp. IMCC44359 TaxID=3459125 RepID=UPI00403AE213